MTRTTPTLARLCVGQFAGAVVGALFLSLSMSIRAGEVSFDILQFAFTALVVFVALALTMPLAQAPLWFVLRSLRLPDAVASTLAGGLGFLAPAISIMVVWGDYVGYAAPAENVAWLSSWAFAGLIAGFVAWRVASFEVS